MATVSTIRWYPKRGEVYWARVDKMRPVIVLSVDALNRRSLDVCVVPLTSVHHREFSLRVPISASDAGLAQPSWAKCDQVTTLEKRLLQPPALGVLSRAALCTIENQVKLALGLL